MSPSYPITYDSYTAQRLGAPAAVLLSDAGFLCRCQSRAGWIEYNAEDFASRTGFKQEDFQPALDVLVKAGIAQTAMMVPALGDKKTRTLHINIIEDDEDE